MKKIEDLTHEEVLGLTENELERMVRLRMAEAGAKILEPPIEPKYPEKPETDLSLHTVSGVNFFSTSRETITAISDLIEAERSNIYKVDKSYATNSDFADQTLFDEGMWGNPLNASTKGCYSSGRKAEIEGVLAEIHELKTTYKAEKKEYEDSVNASAGCRNEVLEIYNSALCRQLERNKNAERLTQYLELAEGNKDIAWAFFEKAYPQSDEEEEGLLKELLVSAEFGKDPLPEK